MSFVPRLRHLHPLPGLAEQLSALASAGIYIGTPDWRFPGWVGQIYTESRYRYQGSFNEHFLANDCLPEYAAVFPTVCFEGTYYGTAHLGQLTQLATETPDSFRIAMQAPRDFTLPATSNRGGTVFENPEFLCPGNFTDKFLSRLDRVGSKDGPVLFSFPKFTRETFSRGTEFVAALDKFLGPLPKRWKYAVELRNDWLTPEYFSVLRRHGVAHCFNNCGRMPPVWLQMLEHPEAFTTDWICARYLTTCGHSEEAKRSFEPYDKVRAPDFDARHSMAALVRECRRGGRPAFIYVHNGLEGNAPATIAAVVASVSQVNKSL